MGQSGGPPVSITNNQSIRVKGETWGAGPVSLTVDTPSGASLGTPVADAAGRFSIDTDTGPFSGGLHKLVGTQGARSASIDVRVTVLH